MSWLKKIEALKPGDACEFRWPARSSWHKGEVIVNGASSFWKVKLTETYVDEVNGETCAAGQIAEGLYIEHIRLPGQTEAWNDYNKPVYPVFQGHASESALEAGQRIHSMLEDRLSSIPGELATPHLLMVHDEVQVTARPATPFTVGEHVTWQDGSDETWPAVIDKIEGDVVHSRETRNDSTRRFTFWAEKGEWRCGTMTLHRAAPEVHDTLETKVVDDTLETVAAREPNKPMTAMDVYKAFRASGFSYEDSKRLVLKGERVDGLVRMLRRLLDYPLALIVRRTDVREAARLAGISEPPWPVTDENMNTRVLLDKELLRQNQAMKGMIHNFAYGHGDTTLFQLCEAAGVVTQEWMKDRKADQNLVEHIQKIMFHVVKINDAICEHGMELGPQYINEHISSIIVAHRPFEQEGWPYKREERGDTD